MKIGDYVRTKNGLIFKITGGNADNWDLDISFGMLESFEENWLELYRYNDNGSFFDNKNIVKSSSNIIDLIEEDDFINQVRVSEIIKKTKSSICFMADSDYEVSTELKEEDIKSIVTKECFENMEYKL